MDFDRITLIKDRLHQIIDRYPIVMLIVFILGVVFLSSLILLSKLVYLGVLSSIVFILAKQFNIKKITLKKTYQISLHSVTGPLIIEFSAILLGLKVSIPFWFFLITSIFLAAAIYEAYIAKKTKK